MKKIIILFTTLLFCVSGLQAQNALEIKQAEYNKRVKNLQKKVEDLADRQMIRYEKLLKYEAIADSLNRLIKK